jgi:hypothetical protein
MIRWAGTRSRVQLRRVMREQGQQEKPQEPPVEGVERRSMTTRKKEGRRKGKGSAGGSLRRLLNPVVGRQASIGATVMGLAGLDLPRPKPRKHLHLPSTAATLQPASRGLAVSTASLAGRKVTTSAPAQPVRPLPSRYYEEGANEEKLERMRCAINCPALRGIEGRERLPQEISLVKKLDVGR